MAATNQKYLQISFALDDGEIGVTFLTLPIKPEELTRTEPSRVLAVNSMDGAWVDAFGRGLTTLTISGNTGWRDRSGKGDGISQFEQLRDNFIHNWHDLRRKRIDAGKDPNDVRLIFIDALNGNYVADVVPTTFVLRRSKSQPLLLLYNITMTVVKEKAQNPNQDLLDPIKPLIYLDSVLVATLSSIGIISGIMVRTAAMLSDMGPAGVGAATMIQSTVLPAMVKACDVIRMAAQIKQDISLIGKGYVELAGSVTMQASSSIASLSDATSLPVSSLIPLMQLKSELGSAGATLLGSIA